MRPLLFPSPAVVVVAAFALFPGAAGALTPGCPAAQAKSAASLAKSTLGCFAKWAKNPARDPVELRLDACLAKAADRFATAYERALQKYMDCTLDEPVDQVIEGRFQQPLHDLVRAIFQGCDPTNHTDTALRAALIKEAGGAAGKLLSAWSAWLKKPDARKLVLASLKAPVRAAQKMDKAIQRSMKRFVYYDGLPAPEILGAVDDAVMNLVEVAGQVRSYSVEGTSEWMGCRDPSDDGLHEFEGFGFFTGLDGGPVAGGWLVLIDGLDPAVGNLSGQVDGGVLNGSVRYQDDSRGTGVCSGAIGDPMFDLACAGQDERGDTCSWTAEMTLVRD